MSSALETVCPGTKQKQALGKSEEVCHYWLL